MSSEKNIVPLPLRSIMLRFTHPRLPFFVGSFTATVEDVVPNSEMKLGVLIKTAEGKSYHVVLDPTDPRWLRLFRHGDTVVVTADAARERGYLLSLD